MIYDDVKEELYRDNIPPFDYHRWHENAIDVMPKSGSKAIGIREMIERMVRISRMLMRLAMA